MIYDASAITHEHGNAARITLMSPPPHMLNYKKEDEREEACENHKTYGRQKKHKQKGIEDCK